MVTFYDYFIIAFYLAFILGVGFVFRRMSKNTSDYFRAGGLPEDTGEETLAE